MTSAVDEKEGIARHGTNGRTVGSKVVQNSEAKEDENGVEDYNRVEHDAGRKAIGRTSMPKPIRTEGKTKSAESI